MRRYGGEQQLVSQRRTELPTLSLVQPTAAAATGEVGAPRGGGRGPLCSQVRVLRGVRPTG